jgi:hypothetical protein
MRICVVDCVLGEARRCVGVNSNVSVDNWCPRIHIMRPSHITHVRHMVSSPTGPNSRSHTTMQGSINPCLGVH